jgi:endothelin-converting enzyme/putative endopeptidase
MTPHFDWSPYLKSAGIQHSSWLNVSEPAFLVAMESLLETEPLNDIKVYLRWALLNAQADYLSKSVADQKFSFDNGYLRGVAEQQPRWKKCVARVDRHLGDALGKEFVERAFPASVKAQAVRMTEQIQRAMRQRIERLTWMSPSTKTQALAKLAKMRNKVGYPDLWRDYTELDVKPGDFYGNVTRATRFENHRRAAKIGRPVDRAEWSITASTVNAYYDDNLNDINFPAGILLPPLFDPRMDDAPNYGNTGGTIGHELTHGFDDAGRQFDGDGNLQDWWQKSDAAAFEKGAQCVRDQYAGYTIVDDIKINSKLTAGEDIADLGGLILAWAAWQEQTKGARLISQDGLTPEQRFFVGYAQWACENQRPENLRVRALVSTHSPARSRINGVAANMPEFARAFHCQVGKALVKAPKDVCKIW